MNSVYLITTSLKQIAQKLYTKNLGQMILFGSWARNEAHESSDIDILLVLDKKNINIFEEQDRIRPFKLDLELEHKVLLQILFVSKSEFSESEKPLYQNIRKEGIIL